MVGYETVRACRAPFLSTYRKKGRMTRKMTALSGAVQKKQEERKRARPGERSAALPGPNDRDGHKEDEQG
ncbi:MAG: hypothetical protein K2N07_01290, partial [Desulfovibrio sp.]|nr:hypothetical protein [Desulfovibrio sp.]